MRVSFSLPAESLDMTFFYSIEDRSTLEVRAGLVHILRKPSHSTATSVPVSNIPPSFFLETADVSEICPQAREKEGNVIRRASEL